MAALQCMQADAEARHYERLGLLRALGERERHVHHLQEHLCCAAQKLDALTKEVNALQALRTLIGDQACITSWENIYGPNWREEMATEAVAARVYGFAPMSPRFQELPPSPSQPVEYGPGLQAPPDSPPPSEWRCDPCHAPRVASAEKQALWAQDAPPTVAARIPLSERRYAQPNVAAGMAELEAQVARCREALAAVPSPARPPPPAK